MYILRVTGSNFQKILYFFTPKIDFALANSADPDEMPHSVQIILSHDAASGSDIMPCNKIDKPLVVYRFSIVK